jgi:ATP-dependent RNA helicase DDX52/ROK1
VWVLLCTDLLARGVDFKGVNMVVNYDFPPSSVSYIHRIGRTGRAGKAGLAVTFFTEADMPALRSIANVVRLSGGHVPDWMLALKQERRDVKKRRETGPPLKRDTINTAVGAGFNTGRSRFKKTAGGKKGGQRH